MADNNFPSAAEAQSQQNNANANTETAPITQEYMLTQIQNSIKVRTAGGSSYADFNFSIFKSGKYTGLLLYYAGLVKESNASEPYDATKAQKYAGIPANNPMKDKTVNWWKENIADYLTGKGYKWTFLYYRDAELPFGFRVSWSTDTTNTETNPIWSAQNKEFPYVILPKNHFILQKAADVEVAETLPAGQEATSERFKNLFTIINNKIANAAQLGHNTVLIPWTAFGAVLDVQLALIQLKADTVVPTDTTTLDLLSIHELFDYGSLNSNKVYGSAKYKIYNINEIKESKSGVAPIVFFTSSNANSDYYLYNPTTDANSDSVKDFTLKTMLNAGGYDSVVLYADVDSNGQAYCAGLALDWADGNATTAAKEYYNTKKAAYDATQNITYTFDDIPVYSDYNTAVRNINAMYMSKLIDLTCSKMRGAFEKRERSIVILWTEIDAKNPKKVRSTWRSTGTIYFDGKFSTSLYTTPISQTSNGIRTGYNTLMNGAHFDSVQANDTYNYVWAYVAYKDTAMTDATSATIKAPTDTANSCGITVYLTDGNISTDDLTNMKDTLTDNINDYLKQVDPSKK